MHSDESLIMRIEGLTKKEIEKLLDEYRESDPEEYNGSGWEEFLRERGIEAEIIKVDEEIYF